MYLRVGYRITIYIRDVQSHSAHGSRGLLHWFVTHGHALIKESRA